MEPHTLPETVFTPSLLSSVSSLTKANLDSCAEETNNECAMVLSIFSEEARDIPPSQLPELSSSPSLITRVLDVNLRSRELLPFSLITQIDADSQSSHPIRFFPLLTLRIIFPASYPRAAPPVLRVGSEWLPAECVRRAKERLEKMWTPGNTVLYAWLDFVQSGLVTQLQPVVDAKLRRIVLPKSERYHDIVDYLLFFNEQCEKQEFNNTDCQCPVCLVTKSGKDCVRVPICKHFACRECLLHHVTDKIQNGDIANLVCIQWGCKMLIPEYMLRELLTPELFEKYQRFSLRKALDKMPDVAWCPECESPAFKEDAKSTVALCGVCSFRFCTKCGRRAHPFERCKALVLEEIKHEMRERFDTLEVSNMTAQEAEQRNQSFMRKCTKKCPSCRMPILKIDGCNHMHCMNCGKDFCWLCLRIIIDVGHHFSSGCAQFAVNMKMESNINRAVFRKVTMMVEEKKVLENVIECPKCQAKNEKEEEDNLMVCHACKTQFCYFCGEEAGKDHYSFGSSCLRKSKPETEKREIKAKGKAKRL